MSSKEWVKNKLDGAGANKTYIGTVEENNDPKRLGRCKIRVLDVFDEKDKNDKYEISVEDLPWASPWKDVNGNNFNIPEKGKVVTVVFEDGNKNNPEYISSDHYNVNLEKKLEQLSEGDYLSMKALLYDHKTQIYVNDSEGLKIDHKFNNINIRETSINVNLKDNFGKINIGSPNSTQRAILGDNFVNWFDEFLNILMGSKGGPFLGNLLSPIVATPALMAQIQLYFSLKDPKILSKNVYIVDNDSVVKQERTEGGAAKGSVSEGQKGDVWKSTVDDNKLTTKEPVKFTPVEGPTTQTFEKPPANASTASTPSELAPEKPAHHPDIDVLLEMMRIKNYKVFTRPYELNVVSIRNQALKSGDKYTDEFVDKLYAFYKDDKDVWQLKQYVFSTMPGVEFEITKGWIKEKDFKRKERKYWEEKIGTKITLKDFMKGPISQKSEDEDNPTGNGVTASGTTSTAGATASGTASTAGATTSGATTSGTASTTETSDLPAITPTTKDKLEKDGFIPNPGEDLTNKTLLDSNITMTGKGKTAAESALNQKLKDMKIDTIGEIDLDRNTIKPPGLIFFKEDGENVVAKWIIFQK